jgi:hypothetical protein
MSRGTGGATAVRLRSLAQGRQQRNGARRILPKPIAIIGMRPVPWRQRFGDLLAQLPRASSRSRSSARRTCAPRAFPITSPGCPGT